MIYFCYYFLNVLDTIILSFNDFGQIFTLILKYKDINIFIESKLLNFLLIIALYYLHKCQYLKGFFVEIFLSTPFNSINSFFIKFYKIYLYFFHVISHCIIFIQISIQCTKAITTTYYIVPFYSFYHKSNYYISLDYKTLLAISFNITCL